MFRPFISSITRQQNPVKTTTRTFASKVVEAPSSRIHLASIADNSGAVTQVCCFLDRSTNGSCLTHGTITIAKTCWSWSRLWSWQDGRPWSQRSKLSFRQRQTKGWLRRRSDTFNSTTSQTWFHQHVCR